MAGEPEYIKSLKREMQAVSQSMNVTEKAIVRIDTTLAETLPAMKGQLEKLNGSVRQHDKDIALQQQAHNECPARKASGDNPNVIIDLSNTKTKIALGGAVGLPTLVLILEVAQKALEYFSQ